MVENLHLLEILMSVKVWKTFLSVFNEVKSLLMGLLAKLSYETLL